MDIQLPAYIPTNDTITKNTRIGYFDLYVEINAVSSGFFSKFDCFASALTAVTSTLSVVTAEMVAFMDDGMKI